jgi:hypothetical protein
VAGNPVIQIGRFLPRLPAVPIISDIILSLLHQSVTVEPGGMESCLARPNLPQMTFNLWLFECQQMVNCPTWSIRGELTAQDHSFGQKALMNLLERLVHLFSD